MSGGQPTFGPLTLSPTERYAVNVELSTEYNPSKLMYAIGLAFLKFAVWLLGFALFLILALLALLAVTYLLVLAWRALKWTAMNPLAVGLLVVGAFLTAPVSRSCRDWFAVYALLFVGGFVYVCVRMWP